MQAPGPSTPFEHEVFDKARAFKRLPVPVGIGKIPVAPGIVARVRPRASKGITDLLLLSVSYGFSTVNPSKKSLSISGGLGMQRTRLDEEKYSRDERMCVYTRVRTHSRVASENTRRARYVFQSVSSKELISPSNPVARFTEQDPTD